MKVVLDTNVLLAGFGTRGLCEAAVTACLQNHELILSDAILGELHRHLADKFKLPVSTINEIIEFLREQTTFVVPADVVVAACRDPDDLPVLGTAVAGAADCLVTGDSDLLVLRHHAGIDILSPRRFYDRLQ